MFSLSSFLCFHNFHELFYSQSDDFSSFSGTPTYYPPEFFTTGRYNGEELDFWGATLVLYMMIEGTNAFENKEEVVNKKLIVNRECSLLLRLFFYGALHKQRERRLNFYTVWDHHWLQ